MPATPHAGAPRPPVSLPQAWLARAAATDGERLALVCGTQRLTYRTLDERSDALATGLQSRGVGPGDRVLVYADNTPETVVAFWAILKAHAVACLVNPLTKAQKLRRLIADCRPAVLLTDAHLYRQWPEAGSGACLKWIIYSGVLDEADGARVSNAVAWQDVAHEKPTHPGLPPPGAPSAPAALLYTAGPTGAPRGSLLTHSNLIAATQSLDASMVLDAQDVVLCALPLSSRHGLYPMLAACRAGARLVLERSFAFPGEVLGRMVAEKVTVFPALPGIFGILATLKNRERYSLSAVRCVVSGDRELPLSMVRLLATWFAHARVCSMYGEPECGCCLVLEPGDVVRKAGSAGIAVQGVSLRIVDSDGRDAPAGTPGELVVSGAAVSNGYWDAFGGAPANASVRPLRTGARFRRDDEGYYYFEGRLDGLLESRGERIAPREIEAAVLGIAGVLEATVVGVPDALLGEAIKVFVVPAPGAALTAKQVLRACAHLLETYMVPRFVEITSVLPAVAGKGVPDE